jgi:hypothetical protein
LVWFRNTVDRAYRAGTSLHWVKVKNPKHPAMTGLWKRLQNDFGLRAGRYPNSARRGQAQLALKIDHVT